MRPMLNACQRAKIKPAISFHVLRHTHGSTLAMRRGRVYRSLDVPTALAGQELLRYDDVFPYMLRHGCTMFICPTFMVRRGVFAEVGRFGLKDLISLSIWKCGCA